MDITLSLNHAQATNTAIVGERAADLASIHLARYPVPPTFIIPCTFFDEFLHASGIASRIGQIYANYPQTLDGYTRAFKELSELFHHIRFTAHVRETLQDAYESLAQTKDAQGLLEAAQPTVNLIPSPTYQTGELAIRSYVKGLEGFIAAIKDAWLSLFLPEQVLERQHFGIERFSIGIIVQPVLAGEGIGEGYYNKNSETPITIKTYLGALDTEAIIVGDTYSLAAEHLHITERVIRTQPYGLKWTGTSLLEQALGDVGVKQKCSDRQVLEVARLTKRAHVTLEKDVICYCNIAGEDVTILFVRRLDAAQLTRTVDESPAPAPQPQDDYIELDEMAGQPLPETSMPTPEETVDDDVLEDVTIEQPDDDYPEMPIQEQEPSQQETTFTSDQPIEVYAEDDAEEQPAEQQAYVQEQEEPAQEETLFDMMQADDEPTKQEEQAFVSPEEQTPPAQAASMPLSPKELIDTAMGKVEQAMLAAYQEAFGEDPQSYEEMKARLGREGKLVLSERDMHRIEQAHASSQNDEEIRDKALGLAWRLLQELR